MSTSTPNIGLTLPVGVEKVSRAIINENMTKIDTAFGNINRATMREVPFTIAVADWSGSGSSWSATYLTDYVTSTSKEILTYTSSLRTAKAEDIDANKKSGGGGIVFTTTKKPVASISGSIYVWDSDDGKIPVIIEGTVTPVENGGTGASSVAGAKNNLGISAVENSVQSLSEQMEKRAYFRRVQIEGKTTLSISVPVFAMCLISTARDTDAYSTLAFVVKNEVSQLVSKSAVQYTFSNGTLSIYNNTNWAIDAIVIDLNHNVAPVTIN